MKAFINAPTGHGKTALSVIFALIYRKDNTKNPIYANFQIDVNNFIYTQFGFLPFSEIKKGNSLIVLDDFGNLDDTKTYSVYLATICRKTNTQMLLTIQYYTQIPKILRELCDYEIIPYLTNLKYNEIKGKYEMTNKTKLIYTSFNPISQDFISMKLINNPLELIKNKYDTTELVDIPNERLIKQEILKFSKNIRDIELNLSIYTKDKRKYVRMLKELLTNL